MRPLVIDDGIIEQIARVKRYAEEHRVSLAQIVRTVANPELAVGDNPKHVVSIPFSYRVVYSIEEQTAGLAHHISISVNGGMPNVEAVREILRRFGLPDDLNQAVNIHKDGHAIGLIFLYHQDRVPNLVKARTVLLSICSCGFPTLADTVPLGTEYWVDFDNKGSFSFICGGCSKIQKNVTGVWVGQRAAANAPSVKMGYLPAQIFERVP